MKVLQIIDNINGGGKEQRMMQLSKGLADQGLEVEILMLENKIDYSNIKDLNIKIHILKGNPKNYLNISTQLYSKIKNINPDIVQIWSNLLPALFISIVSIVLGKKIVGSYVTVASSIPFLHKYFFLKKMNFLLSTKIVANSQAGLDAFKVPKSKAVLIYNGFDESRIKKITSPDLLREKHNINEKIIVIMAARFSDHKDYNTYLDAAKIILLENSNVAFLCLGKGDTMDRIKKEYKHEHIYFLGFQEDSISYLNLCDISVLCTNNNTHREGVSNSLIESMFLQKPIIGTSGGGTNEVIINNENGFLIEPFNSNQLSEKIMSLIQNENERALLGQRSLDVAIKKFSLKDKVEQYVRIYKELC